jgi:CheY-like chemotaxis protein
VRAILQDNGPGIPAENLKLIFNPFFTTKEVGKGTGLGLSLCYGIVSEHGGSITPRSAPGEGATFVIELPVAPAAGVPAPAETRAAASAPVPAVPTGGGKRVLVIDDEDPILQMIQETLSRNGYRVNIAHDGESALAQLKQDHYDLALCDWRMPGLSGQQVYERLESTDPEMSRRFVFMTGDVVNDKNQEFLRSRNKICLAKPFTLAEFHTAINEIIKKG